ncbi:unnamed protein product [Urochloa humidicola]
MHAAATGGRLSAAEKGKQKADAILPGAAALRPAPRLSPTTEIEEVPPSPPPLVALSQLERNQAALGCLHAELQQLRGGLGGDAVRSPPKRLRGGEPRPWDEARWCADTDVRHRPLGPSAASASELPPSPPPPPSRLLAMNAAAAALAGMAAELERKEVELAVMASRLQQLRRERGGGGGASSGRTEGEPRRQDEDAGEAAAAEIDMLERKVGTIRDGLVAFRLQQQEMLALMESLEAWERKNSSKISGTCNWNRIILVIAFTSGSVLLILFRTMLPLRCLTHILGAITVLSIFGIIAFCCQLFGKSEATKGFSSHIPQLMCVCFLLLVTYTLYLISQAVTSAGVSPSVSPAP